jgi:hypothetical protein
VNETYHLGLLLVVFGGFLALNSTGLFGELGIGAMFVGVLIGVLGLLQSGLARSG